MGLELEDWDLEGLGLVELSQGLGALEVRGCSRICSFIVCVSSLPTPTPLHLPLGVVVGLPLLWVPPALRGA